MKKKILFLFTISLLSIILISCSGGGRYGDGYSNSYIDFDIEGSPGDEHQEIKENDFIKVDQKATSNISLSSSSASYAFVRQMITNGKTIQKDAVRIEEFVNFFDYDYNGPNEDDVFGIKAEMIQTPWNSETNLLMVGMQTKEVDLSNVSNNIVILLDVSGSMSASNKLPLVKEAMLLLVEQMKENDIISLVTYSSGEKVVFEGKTINDFNFIERNIKSLKASGATAGKKGINMAYEVAERHFIEEGNNRIILATDGDFNVGISNTDDLVEFISNKRDKSKVYFSSFGFGYGNYKDEKLERISAAGNGNYYYIDDIITARKAFVDGLNGILYTVARDAMAQITFNSESVLEHRLIGFENRQLSDEQFEDITTDAGEIGTGLQVTAIYELKLKEEYTEDIATLIIKYKSHNQLDEEQYEDSFTLGSDIELLENTIDINFKASLIEFALILIDSKYKGNASIESVLERIEHEEYNLDNFYRKDFIDLVKIYSK